MIKYITPSDALVFSVDPATAQSLRISVAGVGVSYFAMLAGTPIARADAAMPDPVGILELAVATGLISGVDRARPAIFKITDKGLNKDGKTFDWSVKTDNLDAGAYRILMNLLVAREMTSLHVTAIPAPASQLLPLTFAYPASAVRAQFPIEYDPDMKLQSDRSIEIHLDSPPDDETLEQIYAMLAAWVQLPMFGGYAKHRQSPLESAALPDVAMLSEPHVVLQTFQMAFIADEAAFSTLINYFTTGKGRAIRVALIRIT